MSSLSLRSRPREPRHPRRRGHRQHALIEALLDPGCSLPTPVNGFAGASTWLCHQSSPIREVALSWLHLLARRHPELLLAPTHRREIGASVVVRAAVHAAVAIRDVRDFRPANVNGRAQLDELLVHLFQRRPVPAWVTATMMLPGSTLAVGGHHSAAVPGLLPHIGQGGGFINAGLPVEVNRSLARALGASQLKAPRLAIRTCQLLAAGVVDVTLLRIAAHLLAQPAFSTATAEAGLAGFIAWLGRTPVDPAAAGLLCTHALALLRAEPGFSFAGRSAATLLDEARALLAVRHGRFLGPLPASGIAGACVPSAQGEWLVRELLSGQELFDEGFRRRHCVGSYSSRVAGGICAIFRVGPAAEPDNEQRGVTVEVRPAARVVVQVKGYANRPPTAVEQGVVADWARSVGLRLN